MTGFSRFRLNELMASGQFTVAKDRSDRDVMLSDRNNRLAC